MLSHILSPISVPDFLRDYWGKQAVHIKGDAEKFRGLFDWHRVNALVNYNRAGRQRFRLSFEGSYRSPDADGGIESWLSKGATLVLPAVHDMDERVGRLSTMLARDLNTKVSANCYLSHPMVQGFDLHFDRHDVYVVHVKGKKRWVVHEATSPKFPIEAQDRSLMNPPKGKPYLECELDEGDVLYVPRGHWHAAVAETLSIHLSVGVEAKTGIDLLQWLTDQLMASDEFLCRDFPIVDVAALGGQTPDAELEAHVERVRAHLHEVVDGDLFDLFVRRCMRANRVEQNDRLPPSADLEETLTPQTLMTLNPAQKRRPPGRVASQPATLQVRGHQFRFPRLPESVLDRIFSDQRAFRAQDLLDLAPDMTWQDVRLILLELHKRRVVFLVEEHATDVRR